MARATESGAFKRTVLNGSYISNYSEGTESFYMHCARLDSLVNPSTRINQLAILESGLPPSLPCTLYKGWLLNKYIPLSSLGSLPSFCLLNAKLWLNKGTLMTNILVHLRELFSGLCINGFARLSRKVFEGTFMRVQ